MIHFRHLFLLIALLPSAPLYSMHSALTGSAHMGHSLGNASFAQSQCPHLIASRYNAIAKRKPAGALQVVEMHEPQSLIQDRSSMPWQPALQSVELGNVQAVKEHFSAWKYMLLPWHYYRKGIADALEHAAQLPAHKTGAIIDYLLEKVDFADVEDIQILEQNARKQGHHVILMNICAKMHNQKQCCSEDAPNVTPITAEITPLHMAAAGRDYNACVQQLLSWSGPLEEDAYWPTAAMATFEECQQTDIMLDSIRPECKNAVATISANVVQLGRQMKERVRIIQEQKQAKDSEGNTAYDIARAAGASKKLLKLLDPHNHDAIQSLLLQDIDKRTGNPQYMQKEPAKVHVLASNQKPVDPNGPIFQVGDQVVIDGITYKVKSAAKVKGKKLKYLKTH